MPDKVRIINVAGTPIGLIQLDETLAAAKDQLHGRTDEEIGTELLKRLEPLNYIPKIARAQYAQALVREFHRMMGKPVKEEPGEGLVIKVLGAGCNQCRKLQADVISVLAELKQAADVEHITDMQAIASFGVMGTPALVINGQVKAVGSVPPKEKIKRLLMTAMGRS